jgi:hypothetical protein
MPPFPNKPPRHKRKRTVLNPQNVLIVIILLMILLYIKVYAYLFQSTNNPTELKAPASMSEPTTLEETPKKAPKKAVTVKREEYSDWRTLAVDLAGKLPADVLRILKDEDPFGVRTFEKNLLDHESKHGRFLEVEELRELFPCPTDNRITLPDQRNPDKARAFRNGTEPYFLFFQHLRKAGGTNFCSLAEHNLDRKYLPGYYCSAYQSVFSCFVMCMRVRVCACVPVLRWNPSPTWKPNDNIPCLRDLCACMI